MLQIGQKYQDTLREDHLYVLLLPATSNDYKKNGSLRVKGSPFVRIAEEV